MERNRASFHSPAKQDYGKRKSIYPENVPSDSDSDSIEIKPLYKAKSEPVTRLSKSDETLIHVDEEEVEEDDLIWSESYDGSEDEKEENNEKEKKVKKRKLYMTKEERERWMRRLRLRRRRRRGSTREEVEIEAFKKEIKRDFFMPHYCKFMAWGLASLLLTISSSFLFSWGWSFGGGESLEWFGVVLLGFAFMFLIIQPIKVLVVATIITYIFEFNVELASKRLAPHLFSNPDDEEKAARVAEIRQRHASVYELAPQMQMRVRKMELRNITEMNSIIMDIATYTVFIIIVYVMIFGNHSDAAYFSTEVLRNLVVTADYTRSIPLTRVRSYEQFMEYMNETLIPALLTNSTDWAMENEGKVVTTPEPPEGAQDGYLYTEMMDRGWTRDFHIKLLGIPRIRQKRVLPTGCESHPAAQVRLLSCWSELNLFNADRMDYGVAWEPLMPGEANMDDPELLPWRYRTSSENRAMPWFGRLNHFFSYGGGGYVLPLGKTVTNARLTLAFMEFFDWIDPRTRAIFIDFTTYSQNSNLYNVVTIMIEVSATGVFIPSYKIHSDRLLYPHLINYHLFLLSFIIFSLTVFVLAVKEISRIAKVGFMEYFTEVWTIVDLLLVAFGFVSITMNIATIFSISNLLEELDKAANNEFVSFQYAAYYDQLLTYFNAMIVCVVTVKAFRLLTCLVVFHQWERVLRDAWEPLMGLFFLVLCAVFAFSIFFSIIMGATHEEFSTMWGSLPTMLGHTTRRHDVYDTDFLEETPPYLGVLFFGVFIGYTSYMMVSIFNTVLSVHLKAVRAVPVSSHIRLWKYVSSFIWKENNKLPESPLPLEGQTITLQRRRYEVIPPPSIDEVRLQGMKREALQLLTGRDYSEATALNITYIVVSGNAKRPGTDKYIFTKSGADKIVVGEKRVTGMKKIADEIIEERNRELKVTN